MPLKGQAALTSNLFEQLVQRHIADVDGQPIVRNVNEVNARFALRLRWQGLRRPSGGNKRHEHGDTGRETVPTSIKRRMKRHRRPDTWLPHLPRGSCCLTLAVPE